MKMINSYSTHQSSTQLSIHTLTDHADEPTLTNIQLNKFMGTPFKTPKPTNTLRVHAGNPNGIRVRKTTNNYAEYLQTMKTIETDCILLYEINFDTQKPAVKKALHDTTRQNYDFSRLTFSSSSIPSTHHFKPGGTLLLLQGNTTGRVTEKGGDDFGRWCY